MHIWSAISLITITSVLKEGVSQPWSLNFESCHGLCLVPASDAESFP